ncbi:phosphoglucosamine mutase [Marinagarivorans algicola]|uniref:phosphoglucosamine mutase n=1 Tax=Marinagarivorans algicola TaxID=1513270 RepID=UPI0006B4213E|nr:phosphoglucosamine mutase [Marinagarivorans algicola]
MQKYFGTDGIRGLVGEAPITPEFFLKLGWAVGRVLAKNKVGGAPAMVIIGKDTRISGYMFEAALESGLIAAGVDVGLVGPMPTPAIAYLTRTFQAAAGIVISASHNPYTDNGIKLFGSQGTKLGDEVELAIEAELEKPMQTAQKLGKARRLEDAEGRYIEFCKGSVPWGFNLEGLNIALDCANGATYSVAPKVFRELGANVTTIGIAPDGLNINLDCGSTKMKALQRHVLETHADLGVAFDGDGDRVMFVDDQGEVLDGDQLLYLIATYKSQHNDDFKGVVGTLMSNFGFEVALKKLDIPFIRANVGDRYVIEEMNKNDWTLGGESSGHIVCRCATTTGDGIIAALQALLAVKSSDKPLGILKQGMQKMPQVMINVPCTDKAALNTNDSVKAALAHAELELGDAGRVLLRPSGTEPVVRVMVEGKDQQQVQTVAEQLAAAVEEAGL